MVIIISACTFRNAVNVELSEYCSTVSHHSITDVHLTGIWARRVDYKLLKINMLFCMIFAFPKFV